MITTSYAFRTVCFLVVLATSSLAFANIPAVVPEEKNPDFQVPPAINVESIAEYFYQIRKKSLSYCLKKAALGNSDAHYCVAIKLQRSGDAIAAVTYLRVAAEAGHPFAQNDLGHAYGQGKGIQRDRKVALYWYKRAAALGVPHAMVSVGWYYMCGFTVAIDYKKARLWNYRGADWDRAEGANNLGWLYEYGLGGPRDLESARYWYTKGAKLGSEEAEERLLNINTPEELRQPNTNDCE